MYAQCGSLPKAQKVFDELLDKNVITWTALIAGYVEDGQEDRAFKCFEQMQSTGLLPNAVTYVCILKACANVKHESKGRDIHVEIERQGFLDDNLFVASALVDMYAKCGSMKKAEQVFDKVAAQDIVLWTTLISGYTENGYAEAALACFEEMQCKGFSPNARTFACILKACGILGNMDRVSEIQVEAEKKGFLKKDIFLGSVLVDIYAKHGLLEKAKEVFDSLTTRDTILWTTLISGYTEHEQGKEALECFDQMQLEGIVPDALTFNCALKACGMTRARDKVQEIHRMIKGQKLLDKLTSVGNALIDAYVKCGCLSQAQQVFKELPSRNVLSWNLLIMGYVELQCHEEAIACFQSMKSKGVTPDTLTYVSILKASSSMEDIEMCEKILAEAEDGGLSKEDLFISSTIVDLYAKCGFLLRAQEAFDKAHVRDVVLWNALIAGFAQEGRGHEALDFLDQMLLEGVPPNAVTLLSGVKACGRIGAAKKGQELHTEIERRGLLDAEHVGNTLIDMYAKCGLLSKAQQVFNKVQNKDVISWTTLMTGYTQCGDVEIVFQIFDTMLGEGIKPNPVTFVVVLSACNHKGMYDKNETYIDAMNRAQGVVPELVYHNYETDPLIYSGKEVNTVNLFRRHRVCSMNVMSHAFLEL
ncbi:hypothetical protein KP509_13G010900 [Ceratopteris richardii]|nr:hypothetical protein KP509_13G010900 [Ceratopteris richardii]